MDSAPSSEAYVYVKRWTLNDEVSWYKIGSTSDLRRRSVEQNVLPVPEQLVYALRCVTRRHATAFEHILHKQLRKFRITVKGACELYSLSDECSAMLISCLSAISDLQWSDVATIETAEVVPEIPAETKLVAFPRKKNLDSVLLHIMKQAAVSYLQSLTSPLYLSELASAPVGLKFNEIRASLRKHNMRVGEKKLREALKKLQHNYCVRRTGFGRSTAYAVPAHELASLQGEYCRHEYKPPTVIASSYDPAEFEGIDFNEVLL